MPLARGRVLLGQIICRGARVPSYDTAHGGGLPNCQFEQPVRP